MIDEFEGGGTRFHNRHLNNFLDAKPAKGQVLISPASINHEGLSVTSGTRYILVGFTSIDDKDPISEQPTGLSVFASWLSLSWIQSRFKEGYHASHTRLEGNELGVQNPVGVSDNWSDNKYVRSLCRDITTYITTLSDFWSQHLHISLVSKENVNAYLDALDKADKEQSEILQQVSSSERPRGRSWWFGGQQIDVNVDGTLASVWASRSNAGEDTFKKENL
mmetsp:Transcript_33355/g.48877  ORF Transcript_33355/g.48877 Transcript_33355/m.48877 type:complete len:221 (+) Transcript_33355:12-674(+)